MNRFPPSFLVLCLLCFLQATESHAAPLELPIEVFGAPGHVEEVEFTLTTEQLNEAESLWLRLHNVAYEYKAQVSINRGDWLELWNDTPEVTVAAKDAAYGGFGGGFQTVECSITADHLDLEVGINTIRFRFGYKHPDFATAGYRVIGLNLLNDSNENILPSDTFFWDDPRTWVPPRPDNFHIDAGRDLWRNPREGSTTSCSECHTRDGFDLKYFNVSNKVIIEQALKSGFYNYEAEQIASYIRSRPYDVVPEARPWNPPYQPGPDIETRDNAAYKWAAGAGIDAVLDSDQEMIEDLFGKENPSEADVLLALNNYSVQPNTRTERLSLQYPDWISWLPRRHPKDLIDATRMENLENAYEQLRAALASGDLNHRVPFRHFNYNGVFEALGEFARQVHLQVAWYENFEIPNSPIWTSLNRYDENVKRSIAAWFSVKLFEVINEFNLLEIDFVELEEQYPFQWPIREWAVFQNAAHIIADQRANSFFDSDISEQQKTKSIYLSSIWYQLQMTLTPGHKMGSGVNPNDFTYNLNHVHKLGYRSGIFEPARFFQNYWLAAAQRNNGILPRERATGWNMRELSPYRLYGKVTPEVPGGPIDLTLRELDNYQEGLQSEIQSAFFRATVNALNQFSYDQTGGDFERITLSESMAEERTDYQLENRDATPEFGVGNTRNQSIFHHRRNDILGVRDAVEVDAAYTLVRLLHQDQIVSDEAFNAIQGWVDSAWDTESWPDWPSHYRIPFPEYVKDTEPSTDVVPESSYYLKFDGSAIDSRGGLDRERILSYDMDWDSNDQIGGTHSGVFDGDSAYIFLGDEKLSEEKSALTFSVWFKTDSLDSYQYIYEQGNNSDGIGLRLNNNRVEGYSVSERDLTLIDDGPITTGVWYFAAVTFDNGELTLFVNDNTPVSVNLSNSTIAENSNSAGVGGIAFFGGRHRETDNYFFDGRIDDLRVWDGVSLSQTQVETVYRKSSDVQNSWPVVSFTQPVRVSGEITRSPGVNQTVEVLATTEDGTIEDVILSRYYNGWQSVGSDDRSPYRWSGNTGLNDPDGLLRNLQPGDYVFRAEATNSFGLTSAAYLQMTIRPYPSVSYAAWFTNNGLPYNDSTRNGDSDAGGARNLLEFALGGDPNDPTDDYLSSPSYAFVNHPTTPHIEFQYNRRKDHASVGLEYSVEVTNDLDRNTWNAVEVLVTVTPLDDPEYEQVISRVYVTGERQYFARIRISLIGL